MNDISDLLRKERTIAWAYLDEKREFDYLNRLNKEYFHNCFTMSEVYDFSFDAYSYWRKNKVTNAKLEGLMTTFKMMYKKFEEAKNEKAKW
jgi:transcriptional accessory protein Tex/SPT6